MHPVLKLVAQRVSLGLVLLFFASILIFMGVLILPGDVAQSILGQSATPTALANLRAELGLDEPALSRYFSWLGGIFQGDLGTALTNGRDIAESIGFRLKNTLFLAFWAAIISVPLAIFLGLLLDLGPDGVVLSCCDRQRQHEPWRKAECHRPARHGFSAGGAGPYDAHDTSSDPERDAIGLY